MNKIRRGLFTLCVIIFILSVVVRGNQKIASPASIVRRDGEEQANPEEPAVTDHAKAIALAPPPPAPPVPIHHSQSDPLPEDEAHGSEDDKSSDKDSQQNGAPPVADSPPEPDRNRPGKGDTQKWNGYDFAVDGSGHLKAGQDTKLENPPDEAHKPPSPGEEQPDHPLKDKPDSEDGGAANDQPPEPVTEIKGAFLEETQPRRVHNPFQIPHPFEQTEEIPAGHSFNFSWLPTTDGLISIELWKIVDDKPKPQYLLASNLTNVGHWNWKIHVNFPHGAGYCIVVIPSDRNLASLSPLFTIVGDENEIMPSPPQVSKPPTKWRELKVSHEGAADSLFWAVAGGFLIVNVVVAVAWAVFGGTGGGSNDLGLSWPSMRRRAPLPSPRYERVRSREKEINISSPREMETGFQTGRAYHSRTASRRASAQLSDL